MKEMNGNAGEKRKMPRSRKVLLVVLSIVTVIATVAACLLTLVQPSYEMIPEDVLVIVDANNDQSIINAGFSADSKNTDKTKFSAKWAVDDVADFQIKNYPTDISQRDTLNFQVKLESTSSARIMFYFGSENKDTEGADYYSFTTVIKPNTWQTIAVDMSKVVSYGEPLGLDKLTEMSIRTTGWRNNAEAGSIFYFGHIYFSGDPVKLQEYNPSTEVESFYPHFTQNAIDDAAELAARPSGWPRFDEGSGLDDHLNSYPAEKCTNALYYLTLAVYYNELDEQADPLYASNGLLCKDAVIQLLEFMLQGGNEPAASVGPFWGHAVMANALYLIKNTEVIYNDLSQDTKDRMDWMMKALAIAGNWGYNDANNYTTGFDLCGNFGKGWNMNYQNTYLSIMLTSALYFGNEELDEILVGFDYDTYMDKFREYNFINVIYTWETAGKTLMETGVMPDGSDPVLQDVYSGTTDGSQVGDYAGSGKGVKIPFRYTAVMPDKSSEVLTLQDKDFAQKLFVYLTSKTYSETVKSSFGDPADEDFCYILGDVTGTKFNEETKEEENIYSVRTSPFEGRLGMFSELNATDGSGIRSSLVYAYDSFEILTGVYTNMRLFGGWDSATEQMLAIDEQIYVGNEDLLFRMEYGYRGHASGSGSYQYEQAYEYRGLWYVKDIWKNVICEWDANTKIKEDLNNPTMVDLPDADPMGGVIEPPAGSLAAQSLYNNMFVDAAYTDIGKLTKGTIAFDMVIGNDVPIDGVEEYDTVIAIMSKGQKETWANMEMSIQLQDRLVNIRSGSSYARTGFQFEANYRFHAELTFDAQQRVYSAKIYQIYPTIGEVYECSNIPFRSSGDIKGYVDSIAVLRANKTSDLWLENVYVNGTLIPGTDVKYDSALPSAPVDNTPPDTMLRVHRDVWRDFVDYTRVKDVRHTQRETVVIMAEDKLSELEYLAYYVSDKPLSEAAVKELADWIEIKRDIACFKIEPYTKYYVYVKSVDSEGNVGYVSSCVMRDPDVPTLSGVTDGKTYCTEQTIKVGDRYLASVTINGEEVIDRVAADGTLVLEKNIGKAYIVVTDKAGNSRSIAVRISDTVLADKIIIDSENKDTITKAGLSVEEEQVFNGSYAARWDVMNDNLKFNGVNGDFSDYKTLKFSVKVVPGDNTQSCSFLMFFGSENNEQNKLQYYQRLITVNANQWYEFSIDLADFTRTRGPSWRDIRNVRIYANNWGNTTNVMPGSQIYIGYMYLVAGDEDRVHASEDSFEIVPGTENPAVHEHRYTCCNTVVKTEAHTKGEASDNCSVCGQDMNVSLDISCGDTKFDTLAEESAKPYFTNSKKLQIWAKDYGFGIQKLEYATSNAFVPEDKMDTLAWTTVQTGHSIALDAKTKDLFVYTRVTDGTGKVTYVSAGPITYDDQAPVITGVEKGITYCEPPTISVSDEYLSKVTVGGKEVKLTDGKYTFEEDCGTKTVVATDKAGNKTSLTVTVSGQLQQNYDILAKDTLTVDGKHAEYFFIDKLSNEVTNVSGYKTLTFRMKVTPRIGTTATKVRIRMAQWSHTYFEWVVDVTPNQWQTVTIDLHDPQITAGSMSLANVRVFTFIALDGAADVPRVSTIQLENVCLKEVRVHDETKGAAYSPNTADSTKHDVTLGCCNTVVKTEAHALGVDGLCIYCTAPQILGVQDGATYCTAPAFTVKDNNTLSYVKVNGEAVTLDQDGKYTLPNEAGRYVIRAMDEHQNMTEVTVTVLPVALTEGRVVFNGFTFDFATDVRKTLKDSDGTKYLGLSLASYTTVKFDVKITSAVLEDGTEVDFWWRLFIDGNTYYLYHQKAVVGQVNQMSFDLNAYKSAKGDPKGFAGVNQIMFEGDWSGTELGKCAIEVSDITLHGLEEVRVHDETKGVAYTVNAQDATKHDVISGCCNAVLKTEAHTLGADGLCIYCAAPQILGVQDGATYCCGPTFMVKDNNGLSSVQVNGETVTLDQHGKYTLPNEAGRYVIRTMDEYRNVTEVTVTVLPVELTEGYVIAGGFTHDFGTGTRKTLKNSAVAKHLGLSLESFTTVKFDVKITSAVLAEGTEVDFWWRLFINGNTYYLYHQKAIVGQVNQMSFDLTAYKSAKGDPKDFIGVSQIMFEGDWSNTALKKCVIEVSDITLHGLNEVRCHTYDQEVADEAYRVNAEEIASCINGFDYYKSCVCGAKSSSDQFEGPLGANHASTEFTYELSPDNSKLHIKYHKCCDAEAGTEAHSCDSNTVHGATVECDECGADFVDWMDKTAPVITGVVDGYEYIDQLPVMVATDDVKLDSVTVNGVNLTLSADSKTAHYTFVPAPQVYRVVATDMAGNQTIYTFSVKVLKSLFAADFENTTTASGGVAINTLTEDGWDDYSRNHTSNSEASNSRFAVTNGKGTNATKSLRLTTNGSGAARAWLEKKINVTGLDNVTVEFQYYMEGLVSASGGTWYPHLQLKCVNGDASTDNGADDKIFYRRYEEGALNTWISIKVELKRDGTTNTWTVEYSKKNASGGWDKCTATEHEKTSVSVANDELYLCFFAYLRKGVSQSLTEAAGGTLSVPQQSCFIDDVSIYTVTDGNAAPNVFGVENGGLYYVDDAPVIKIKDYDLEKVMVNADELIIDRTGPVPMTTCSFTSAGEYTIVAKDTAGNETRYTITVKERNVLYSATFEDVDTTTLSQTGLEFSTLKSLFGVFQESHNGNKYLKLTSIGDYSAYPRIRKSVDVTRLENLTVMFDFMTYDTDGESASKKLYLCHNNEAMSGNTTGKMIDLNNFWTGKNTSDAWQTVKVEYTVENSGASVTGSAYVLADGVWVPVDGYQNVTYHTENGVLYLNFVAYLSNQNSFAYLDNIKFSGVSKNIAPEISGVEDGQSYDVNNSPVVTVRDNDLVSVTVNDTPVSISSENLMGTVSYQFTAVGNYKIFAKDEAGNEVTYTVTVTDAVAPVISGVENGGSYALTGEGVVMTVTDRTLQSVTVNGTALQLDASGETVSATYQFTEAGIYQIEAVDAKNNKTTCTVTIQGEKNLFTADFENTTTNDAGTSITTDGDGWDDYSRKYTGKNDPKNSRLYVVENIGDNTSKCMQLTTNGDGAAGAWLEKKIGVTGLDNVIIEAQYYMDATVANGNKLWYPHLQLKCVNGDANTGNSTTPRVYYRGYDTGALNTWISIKVELTRTETEGTWAVKTYMKDAQGVWVQATLGEVTEIEVTNNEMYLCFYSYLRKNAPTHQSCFIDNVRVYTTIE